MALSNDYHNAVAARPAAAWKQRLGTGVVAWVALGVASALLDPRLHGAGLISLFGGFVPWLATGAGLILTALAGQAVYRRRGLAVGIAVAGLGLGAIAAVLAFIDWQAVTGVIAACIGLIAGLLLFISSPDKEHLAKGMDTEWKWGSQGSGFYSSSTGVLIDSDEDD